MRVSTRIGRFRKGSRRFCSNVTKNLRRFWLESIFCIDKNFNGIDIYIDIYIDIKIQKYYWLII